MKATYILETGPGDSFDRVAIKAKKQAEVLVHIKTVEFEFNGRKVLVNKNTNLDLLWRDYSNSWIMDWKEIGPDCVAEYAPELQSELVKRQQARDAESERQRKDYEAQEAKDRQVMTSKVAGIEIEIIPGKTIEYKKYVETNSDGGYSYAVIEYSENWAKLMQIEIANGKEVKDVANETQKGLSYIGITGFQYGCALKGLSYFWKHGEALRKWHNKEYNHEGDGVVNPAILTLKA